MFATLHANSIYRFLQLAFVLSSFCLCALETWEENKMKTPCGGGKLSLKYRIHWLANTRKRFCLRFTRSDFEALQLPVQKNLLYVINGYGGVAHYIVKAARFTSAQQRVNQVFIRLCVCVGFKSNLKPKHYPLNLQMFICFPWHKLRFCLKHLNCLLLNNACTCYSYTLLWNVRHWF